MKILLLISALAFSVSTAQALVARPAPNVQWVNSSGKVETLASFKGQPVVLLISPTPQTWAFRFQLTRLKSAYQQLGNQNTVFVAAFTQETGRVNSNIPFAVAADGPKVGFEYDATDRFAIAIIGRDGNLDYFTNRVLPGQRIIDVIANSYVTQSLMRRP